MEQGFPHPRGRQLFLPQNRPSLHFLVPLWWPPEGRGLCSAWYHAMRYPLSPSPRHMCDGPALLAYRVEGAAKCSILLPFSQGLSGQLLPLSQGQHACPGKAVGQCSNCPSHAQARRQALSPGCGGVMDLHRPFGLGFSHPVR
jgi:hypothetical protein